MPNYMGCLNAGVKPAATCLPKLFSRARSRGLYAGASLLPVECFPVEEQGFVGVLLRKIPPVVARVEMGLMRIAGFREHLVELAGADFEAVIVFGAAVEVQL